MSDPILTVVKALASELVAAEADRAELVGLLQATVDACRACLVEMSKNGDSVAVRTQACDAVDLAVEKWAVRK